MVLAMWPLLVRCIEVSKARTIASLNMLPASLCFTFVYPFVTLIAGVGAGPHAGAIATMCGLKWPDLLYLFEVRHEWRVVPTKLNLRKRTHICIDIYVYIDFWSARRTYRDMNGKRGILFERIADVRIS